MTITTGVMSNYLENKIVKHMLIGTVYTMPTQVWLGVHTSATGAGDENSGTEKTGSTGEFARASSVLFDEWQINEDVISNNVTKSFSITSSAWGTVYGWGMYDQATGGNLLFWGLFDVPVYISTGEALKIPAGTINISFSQEDATHGGWTSFSITKMAEWLVNGTPFNWTLTGSNMALLSGITTSGSNNLTGYTELSALDYERKHLSTSTWSATTDNTRYTNTNDIVFTTEAEEDWGTITDILLFDNDTGLNAIFWGHLVGPITISVGDGFKTSANMLVIIFL